MPLQCSMNFLHHAAGSVDKSDVKNLPSLSFRIQVSSKSTPLQNTEVCVCLPVCLSSGVLAFHRVDANVTSICGSTSTSRSPSGHRHRGQMARVDSGTPESLLEPTSKSSPPLHSQARFSLKTESELVRNPRIRVLWAEVDGSQPPEPEMTNALLP